MITNIKLFDGTVLYKKPTLLHAYLIIRKVHESSFVEEK